MRPCDGCGADLVPVFEDRCRRYGDVQYEKALGIKILGGYGMFDDPANGIWGQALTILLCHDCAHAFVKNNSWAQQYIDDANGHSHPELPNHDTVSIGEHEHS